MRFENTIALAALVTVTLATSAPARAGDVVQDMRSSEPGPSRENGGFLELGIDVDLARPAIEDIDPEENGSVNLTTSFFSAAAISTSACSLKPREAGSVA